MDPIFSFIITILMIFFLCSFCARICCRRTHGQTFTTVTVPQSVVAVTVEPNQPYMQQQHMVPVAGYPTAGPPAQGYPGYPHPNPYQQMYPPQAGGPQSMPPQPGFVDPNSFGPYPFPNTTNERSQQNPPTYDQATAQAPFNPNFK